MMRQHTPLLFFATLILAGLLVLPAAADNVTVTPTDTATIAATTVATTATTAPVTTATTVATTATTAPVTTTTTDVATSATTVPAATTTTTAATTETTVPVTTATTVAANAPVASFTATPVSGTYPLTVAFTDTSTNSPTSWNWDFGDGSTGTDENPSHTYAGIGSYTVTLTATNSAGSNEAVQTSLITVTAVTDLPVVSFTHTETTGFLPLSVSFTDTSANTPTTWNWTFGDGGTSSDQNPTHIYENAGDYAVMLTATNTAGANSTTSVITISALQEPTTASTMPAVTAAPTPVPTTPKVTLPEISFSGIPVSGAAPLSVAFSGKIPGTPRSISWDFGDGGTSTEQDPSYTYVVPGTYTVTLTVEYAGGTKTSVQTNYITVAEPAAGSPLPPATAVMALVGAVGLSAMYRGRKQP